MLLQEPVTFQLHVCHQTTLLAVHLTLSSQPLLTHSDCRRTHAVCPLLSAALPPDQLFSDGGGEAPLLDLEGLQFEGAVEGEQWVTPLD